MEKSSFEQEQDEIIIKCGLEEMVKAFFKDYEIIWHDPNVNSQENQQYLAQLEALCPVKTFTEWKKAENYIKDAKTVCHMITSGTDGELLVKEIFSSQNVPNILTFCRNEEDHSIWAKNYEKVLCIETKIENVISQIQKNLLKWHQQSSSLKLDLPAFAPIFDDWDKSQMNHLHHYLKVIPKFYNRAQAKKDFVELSKKLYEGQIKAGKAIAEFEGHYNQYDMETILKWYTKPSFLHKVINNSLRIATSDSIQYCRLVLKDLERAIKDQYQKKSREFSGLLYRRAYLSEEEWSSLKANLNKEIETHGFLSASKCPDIAWKFIASDPKKIFITIIVPKGPSEEEQGFAEVEEFSLVPHEKEILFNVRSRFTVLETQDEYSKDKPNRHLVLLFGAQGLRKYITEKHPVHHIEIEDVRKILCSYCRILTGETPGALFFISIINLSNKIYSCQECLDNNTAAPFLCFPIANKEHKAEIKGCFLTNSYQAKIPMYGYKCSKCGAKNQKKYFSCTDCGEKEKRWCEDCFGKTLICTETRHAIILENYAFSFWCEKMSENELNHLKFQNNFVAKHNHQFLQAEMYFETHEYEKAIEFYNRSLVLFMQLNWQFPKLIIHSYSSLGSIYFERAEYTKALEYHLKSLNISKTIYGENHPYVAAAYQSIGMIYDKQGEHVKALEYLLKSLNIKKSFYGENHPNVAASYGNIGVIYDEQGEHVKALEYYLKSLDIYKSIYGENHPNVAASYGNIGIIYDQQGEHVKALEYFLKSLDIRKSIYGENHPDLAASYCNIGSIYNRQAEYTKALEYYLKSLDIRKPIYGENHPNVAASYYNIGVIYDKQGENMKALEYFLKSLDISLSVYGENHYGVAASYQGIGIIYDQQGEHIKALEYLLKALNIQKSVYGENHFDVAASYQNIGVIYGQQGELVKALEYSLKSLNIHKSFYGENHPKVAASYQNMGIICKNQGEHMKALEYLLKSLDISRSVYGENHPLVVGAYYNIGLTYREQRENMKALEYFLKFLEISRSMYGENHPRVAASYQNIGIIYDQQGEHVKALEYFLKVYGENHPQVAASYHNVGLRYSKQAEYTKALEYFVKSLDIRRLFYGENHSAVAASYHNIGVMYDKQGEHVKALEYFLKVYGENHPQVAASYQKIGVINDKQGEYKKALEYYSKSLDIKTLFSGKMLLILMTVSEWYMADEEIT